MGYMGNEQWWDERFIGRTNSLMQPEEELIKDVELFPMGETVLDVACGDGRNAIFLAKKGFQVTGLDFSKHGLVRLNAFAKQNNVEVEIVHRDLDTYNVEMWASAKKYDVIIINHYRPTKELLVCLQGCLKKSGLLWVNGFWECPPNNSLIREGDLLCDDDFFELDKMGLRSRRIYELGKRKFIKYLFKRY